MSLLQQIGQSVGHFLASKRGVANGFAATDHHNQLLAAHVPAHVITRDSNGKIALADLPDDVGQAMRFHNDFDASSGALPITPSTANIGWVWRVTVGGVVQDVHYEAGDCLVCTGMGFVRLGHGTGELGAISEFTAALSAAFAEG